ncbi:unnamed protein product [Zymoseptoria tritici ST99CH_1A5]|uniref:DUF8004 domain-containing protein n=2 Tax=Zymoseptoria tritici TaxID=1047171 RepID=A0A2H1FXD6_ZYMTR|nr:unnamed protein product [Zymoseptoria tritici ST99CH_1E4]SMY21109.1 unnamed protein product [Zymoseptoria tritici ST99CH_1A5]
MARRLSTIFTAGFSLNDEKSSKRGDTSLSPSRDSAEYTSRSKSPGKLSKQAPSSNETRKPSIQYLMTPESSQPSLRDLELSEATTTTALPPPPPLAKPRSPSASRSPGTPGSRPMTPTLILPEDGAASPTTKKKRWWSNKSEKKQGQEKGPVAWVAGQQPKVPYDIDGLKNGRPMQELWNNDGGNCYIHLFPKASNKGASFKVDPAIFASSATLTKLAYGDIYSDVASNTGDRRDPNLSVKDLATPPISPRRDTPNGSSTSSHDSHGRYSDFSTTVQETHLYVPVKLGGSQSNSAPQSAEMIAMEDLQTLIDYRNFFAFLSGQSLIATERRSSLFAIFYTVAGILKSYHFANVDGSTYGEVADASFNCYVAELGLADVRVSREATIEGIVLGERMKNVLLYNEAFTHGVGKLDDLLAAKSPRFAMISPVTQNRLTRAAMDLEKRVASIRLIMTDFDFPFLFSGIMSSKTSIERKEGVRFAQWKESFLGMRKFMLGLLKQRYGNWPPKASSKKNSLETSGLNRLVLRDVYLDLSSLYDHIADRTNLTTRTLDGASQDDTRESPVVRGLRAILSEYDRSSPPVKPPVPFDLPLLPTLRTTRPDFSPTDPKMNKALNKRVKDEEMATILRASHNEGVPMTPFVGAFREMEKRAAHGCTPSEIEDLRIGQWIFLYVVLQALPMLACDAPGLNWTQGVEYFLCAPPRSGVPWADPNAGAATAGRRTWFSVGGAGGGVVSLPSDVVEHGVEGIYRRSHCWVMADKWCAADPILSRALEVQQNTHGGAEEEEEPEQSYTHRNVSGGLLPPPMPFAGGGGGAGSRGGSPRRPSSDTSQRSSSAQKRLSSFGLNLEALPLPVGVTPDGRSPSPNERPQTPAHLVDANRTFDSMLGASDAEKKKQRRKSRM